MADQRFYIGSLGPFLYDPTVPIDDPDGFFPGQMQAPITAESSMYEGANRVLTVADLGTFNGTYSVVVGVVAGGGGPKGLMISSRSFVFVKGLLTSVGGVTTVNI